MRGRCAAGVTVDVHGGRMHGVPSSFSPCFLLVPNGRFSRIRLRMERLADTIRAAGAYQRA